MKLNDLDLDAIQARADAATEGPWEQPAPGRVGTPGGKRTEIGIVRRVVDAEFIAHSRTDVPALVAEVRRLRAELAGGGAR